jgi:hypothetical protein
VTIDAARWADKLSCAGETEGIVRRCARAEVEQLRDSEARVTARAISVVGERRVRHFQDAPEMVGPSGIPVL